MGREEIDVTGFWSKSLNEKTVPEGDKNKDLIQ